MITIGFLIGLAFSTCVVYLYRYKIYCILFGLPNESFSPASGISKGMFIQILEDDGAELVNVLHKKSNGGGGKFLVLVTTKACQCNSCKGTKKIR